MAKTPNAPTKALAMLLRVSEEYDWWHLTGHPVEIEHVETLAGSVRPRWLSYNDYDHDGDLGDFKISCQSGRERAREGGESYGWNYAFYSVYCADLRRAKSIVKILTAVEAKIAKIEADLGSARTYDAYLTRVSYSVGITSFMLEHERPRYGSQGRYELVNGTLAAVWIRDQEAAYIARFAPPPSDPVTPSHTRLG